MKALKSITALFIGAICICLVSCGKTGSGSLRFLPPADSGTLVINIDDVILLSLEGGHEGVSWSSSNTTVATVADGYVFGISSGTTEITAQKGSAKASVSVTVLGRNVTSVQLPASTVSVLYTESRTLKIDQITPSEATVRDITWSIADNSIIDIQPKDKELEIKGKKEGTTTVSATSVNGKDLGSFTVKVTGLTSLVLNVTSKAMNAGETLDLVATQSPKTMYDVEWSTSDASIASVSQSGKVTAGSKTGVATIKAKAGSKEATCSISVIGSDQAAAIFVTLAQAYDYYYEKPISDYSSEKPLPLTSGQTYTFPASYAYLATSYCDWTYLIAGYKAIGPMTDGKNVKKWIYPSGANWSTPCAWRLSKMRYQYSSGFNETLSLELTNGSTASVTLKDGFSDLRLDYYESKDGFNNCTSNVVSGRVGQSVSITLSNIVQSKSIRLMLRGSMEFGWSAARYVKSSNSSVITISNNGDTKGAVIKVLAKGNTTLTVSDANDNVKGTLQITVK